MITKFENIGKLVGKYLRKELTEEEQKQLNEWISESDDNKQLFEKWTDAEELMQNIGDWERLENGKQDVWQKMDVGADEKKPRSRLLSFQWWKYAAAAAVIIFLFAGAYFWLRPVNKQPTEIVATPKEIKNDVLPNTKNAVLTLDDGTTIILDSAQTGMLARQGETKVLKMANGQLVYESGPLTPDSYRGHSPLAYNTITVPKGSDVVFLTLSDGSKVWMNAASSIRYPTAFIGNERKVEITGEAYFEVAPSSIRGPQGAGGGKRPFIVEKGDMKVEVLGTHFNVNTYEEEGDIKVTLLEGSVKVSQITTHHSQLLRPGQQAVVNDKRIQLNKDPNLEEVMAWKNGRFVFDNTNLAMIMRQIERWYDVEVSYKGDVLQQEITLTGEISRYSNASQVLELLETTRLLHFTIEGRKVTVTAL